MSVAVLAPADDIVPLVRGASGEALTIVIAPGRDRLALALALAALPPLAIERAPMRVNAVLPRPGAGPVDVEAATRFLERAVSTTGQVLEIG
ncbi:Rossmann fold domain-containing protein [Sphingomonas sp. GC_Shp_2]|uniref:Rossmann fold domain-containing protein n=1 Tax=Sphingomonas sp. GC_Shp_2 TaxID=2937384 RepID=UPI002269CBE2|nr:hypothetical protein [Sphingomonas sp. GC_Shp_2]